MWLQVHRHVSAACCFMIHFIKCLDWCQTHHKCQSLKKNSKLLFKKHMMVSPKHVHGLCLGEQLSFCLDEKRGLRFRLSLRPRALAVLLSPACCICIFHKTAVGAIVSLTGIPCVSNPLSKNPWHIIFPKSSTRAKLVSTTQTCIFSFVTGSYVTHHLFLPASAFSLKPSARILVGFPMVGLYFQLVRMVFFKSFFVLLYVQ